MASVIALDLKVTFAQNFYALTRGQCEKVIFKLASAAIEEGKSGCGELSHSSVGQLPRGG